MLLYDLEIYFEDAILYYMYSTIFNFNSKWSKSHTFRTKRWAYFNAGVFPESFLEITVEIMNLNR